MSGLVQGVVTQEGRDISDLINVAALANQADPVGLLAGFICESELLERAARYGTWPDLSFGLGQQTVQYARVGDHSASAANIAYCRAYYWNPENAIPEAAGQYGHYYQQYGDFHEAWSRYNGGPRLAYADNPNAANIQRGWEAAQAYRVPDGTAPARDTDYAGAAWAPSPNLRRGRQGHAITGVVLHGTAGPNATGWFAKPESEVSAHYVVEQDGRVFQCVREADTAWHAGVVTANSRFAGGPNPNLFCVTPETRVLMADLQWRAAGDVRVDDAIVGFEEYPGGPRSRRFTEARVLANEPRRARVYRLYLEDGTVLRATAEHRWLAQRSGGHAHGMTWRRTDEIAAQLEGVVVQLPRYFDVTPADPSREAGYLAGAYDVAGSLRYARGEGLHLCFTQAPNVVLATVERALAARGFGVQRTQDRRVIAQTLTLQGGRQEVYRFLSLMRPPRLLEQWRTWGLPDRPMIRLANVRVLAAEPDGEQEIAALGSSSLTYVAEGFAAHNTIGVEHTRNRTNTSPITVAQEAASLALVQDLLNRYGPLEMIEHNEIDVGRICPGEPFPLAAWQALRPGGGESDGMRDSQIAIVNDEILRNLDLALGGLDAVLATDVLRDDLRTSLEDARGNLADGARPAAETLARDEG